jgi:hypothetical protein
MDVKTLQQKCAELAVAKLKAAGIEHPLYDPRLSRQANYEKLVQYRMRESALMIELLATKSYVKPEKSHNKTKLEPRKLWGQAYND